MDAAYYKTRERNNKSNFKEEHKMKSMATSNKGLYLGTGIGLILFVLVGLLSGSLVVGLIGLKLSGFIFGAPL